MSFTRTKRDVQEPVTVARDGPGGYGQTETTHPSFAQIGVSRVSGHMNLFDSDFAHSAYMVIRIHPTKLIRNLSNDWFFADRMPYIEVALSEAQWASFVSSPNFGDGVPCTLTHKDGKSIPELPSPPDRRKTFKDEMANDIADTLKVLDEADADIDAMNLPKGKASALKARNQTIRRKLTSSLPFVADQFDEHMEKGVEKAKAEIHGYFGGVIQRAGIAALGNVEPPLQIERDPS